MTKKNHKKIHVLLVGVLLALLFLLEACGAPVAQTREETSGGEQNEEEEKETKEEGATPNIYILLYTNTETQRMFLQDTQTRRQEEFSYTGGTYIRNKYGDNMTASQLQPGELVRIKATDKLVLTEVNITDDTFVYEGVTNFSIDSEEKIITASGSNYYYDDALKIFSETGIIALNDLSAQDTISIRGEEKKILSIVVTKGHGTVMLKNTEVFEGGLVTLGNVVATEITHNMQLEVPEGGYTLSVANEGFGGSREITVKRFEETIVNLDDLKGEGPKSCSLKINVTPENAKVTINGGEADCSQLLELAYGVYAITAQADGYQSWSGTLVVNSEEAAVAIDLEQSGSATNTEDGEGGTESDKSESDEQSGSSNSDSSSGSTNDGAQGSGRAGSLAGSKAGSMTGNNGSNGSQSGGSTSGGSDSNTSGSSASTAAQIISGLNGGGTDSNLQTQLITDLVEELLENNSSDTSSSKDSK